MRARINAGFISLISERCQNLVEGFARAHGGGGFGGVGVVIAAEVDGAALDGEEFGDDCLLGGGEFLRDGGEDLLEGGVLGLGG